MIHPKKRTDWKVMKDTLRRAQKAYAQAPTADKTRVQTIFRKRAERLAVGSGSVKVTDPTTPVLVFKLGDETYGIELRHIAQVFSDTRITPVPGAPEALLGIANLQGEVRSVFGMRRLLALPDSDSNAKRYVLLLRQNEQRIGLQVEHLEGVRQLVLGHLSEHPTESDKHVGYVSGVTHDKVIMLKINRMFE